MDACLARPGSTWRGALFPAILALLLAGCGTPPGGAHQAGGVPARAAHTPGEGSFRSCLALSPGGHARVSPLGPGGRVGTWPG